MFEIDHRDPTPIYAQLERAIQLAVLTGRLAVGDRLPTVRQLAVDLRVNANTVARVYGELERQGVVETRRGVGTFIPDRPGSGLSQAERDRQLALLADRYLAGAAELGCSVTDAVHMLRSRGKSED